MADTEWVKALGSIPGAVSDTFSGMFGGGTPAPTDTLPGAAPGGDVSALAGIGDAVGGWNTGASAGERGLSSAVSQYAAPAAAGASAAGGAAPGAAPVAMPASVGPIGAGGGMFIGSADAAPSSVSGTSSYNTGGAFGPSAHSLGGATTDVASAGGAPGWADAAKSFVKDYGSLAGPAVSGGGLLASLVKGNQRMPGESELRTQAASLAAQGQTLRDYVTNGTLPPGVATSLHSAGEAAKASIRSQYAARGMTGSDAEARDLANVDTSIVTQGASIAANLLSRGIQESQLSANLYNTIMNAATQEDAQLSQAISGFAQSLVPRQNIIIGRL